VLKGKINGVVKRRPTSRIDAFQNITKVVVVPGEILINKDLVVKVD
jgi:hypothetical protein